MRDGFCELCSRDVDDIEQAFCYGCGATICETCSDKGGLIEGRHVPEDHLFDESERADLYEQC